MAAIVGAYHGTPFDILGIHRHTVDGKPAIVIRTLQPQALTVLVLRGDQAYPMRLVHQDGFFETAFHDKSEFFHYRLSITLPALDGGRKQTYEIDDPYRYPLFWRILICTCSERATHSRLYEKLGARILEHAGSKGVVWAPNAERASVVGVRPAERVVDKDVALIRSVGPHQQRIRPYRAKELTQARPIRGVNRVRRLIGGGLKGRSAHSECSPVVAGVKTDRWKRQFRSA